MRPWLLGCLGIASSLLLLTACRSAQSAQSTSVRTDTVRRDTLQVSVVAAGNTVFPRVAKLSFGSAGTVSEVRVRVGQQVSAGEVLARLDTQDLHTALLRAQQDVTNAQKSLQDYQDSFSEVRIAQARAAVETAKANLASAQEAYTKAQNQTFLDIAQAEQRVAEARLGVQRAQDALEVARRPTLEIAQAEQRVAEARVAVQRAQEALDKARQPFTAEDVARAQQRVADARLGVQRAQEALDKARQPYTPEDIARAQENVDLARSALVSAQRALQTADMDVEITRKDWANRLQDAQNQVEAHERTYAQTFLRTYRNLLAVDTSVPPWTMLGVQPSGVDFTVMQAWNTLVSSRNNLEVLRAQAERNLLNAENALQRARDAVTTARQNLSDAEKRLADMLKQPDPLEVDVREKALATAQAVLKQAEEDLAKMKPDPLDIAAKEKALATARAMLKQAEEDLAKKRPDPVDITAKEKALATAQAVLAQAEADLARIRESSDAILLQRAAQVAAARASLASAQDELDKLLKGPDPLTLEARRLQVEVAKASLAQAQQRLENATLKAPFAGVVAQVQAEVGMPMSASTIAVVVVDPSQVEINAAVDETDIARLRVGQEAQVTIEALGPVPLRGRVVALSPVARVQQGVVSYEVTLALTAPQADQASGASAQTGAGQRPQPGGQGGVPGGGAGPRFGQRPGGIGAPAEAAGLGFLALGLREGMTVSARIIIQQKEGVLVVPARAVRTEGGKRVVEVVLPDGKRALREVTVGLTGDQGVEIIAGLQEGETVVVPTTTSSSRTLQPPFGQGMGPGGLRVR
ncbi:MAG: HlyD family efflux transporter periplasmic adaptor subunit [Dehalococcoidia bacterium]|nr:HlyD family efflux transporter periplasmic adaptor subunit [Dehalococcoidia bacterium]MDW8119346.1 HlyD family efflux transporter periplasmic adaptor subunit [Chloroflexota bacterium]